MRVVPGASITEPVAARCCTSRATSMPSPANTPPLESETATILAPAWPASRTNQPPTLPKPCTAKRVPSSFLPVGGEHLADGEEAATSRRGVAPERPVERERLAGHDGGGEAVVLAVLIEEPRHHRGVRAHVGRRDVALGTDELVNVIDEATREALELAGAERLRIALDAALGAAEGHVDAPPSSTS